MEEKKTRKVKLTWMNICTMLGVLLISIFVIYGYKTGIFSTSQAFLTYVEGFGIWSVIIFIVIQAISVIVSFLPTTIGCIAGVLIFGPWLGFLYNYIGICLGSIIAFMLSKRYGSPLVQKNISKKYYDKYIGWVESGKKFDKMFAFAIFFPLAPDDLLCYIAGLTPMDLRKFVSIIILGKPVSLAAYSLGITTITHYIFSLVRK